MEPQSDIIRFIQTWIIVYTSLIYCFFIGKLASAGKVRFLCISPVVALFLLLPLRLTSVHLCGITGFFIAWLGTFKLLLFCFGKGPLSSEPQIPLPRFLAAGSLPIKITPRSDIDDTAGVKFAPKADPVWKQARAYAVRGVLLAIVFKLYDFESRLHPTALQVVYCCHIFLLLELILAAVGAAARAGLGIELEPHFNKPYLASSLSDFWGRRWNLFVTSILRPSVYEPVMGFLAGPMGRKEAQPFAVLATFGVSAIMHELIMYYLNRMNPSGETTAFFLLHGVCVVAETAVARRKVWKYMVPRPMSSCLTIWFVLSTGLWLFFPEFLRGKLDVRAFEEYAALGEFAERATDGTLFRAFEGSASIHYFFNQMLSF